LLNKSSLIKIMLKNIWQRAYSNVANRKTRMLFHFIFPIRIINAKIVLFIKYCMEVWHDSDELHFKEDEFNMECIQYDFCRFTSLTYSSDDYNMVGNEIA